MRTLNPLRFLLILFLFGGCSASMQVSQRDARITGVVVDRETRKPVPMVNVYVRGTNLGTTTDTDGVYSTKIPGGERVLVFSHSTYRKETQVVTLEQNQQRQIVIELDAVPARTNKLSTEALREEASASYPYVITERDIERTWSKYLIEVLRVYTPQLSFNRGNLTLYVDNMQRDPTLVYTIDPYYVEKIVVWRSTMDPVYISTVSARRNVVHVITRQDCPDY